MKSNSQKTITVRNLFDFREIIGDRHLIRLSIGPDLQPILLSSKQAPDYRRKAPNGATFPKQLSDTENEFRIHYSTAGNWFFLDLPPTKENFHEVQPLGTDEWLVVRGRSNSMQDQNAQVIGPDGRRIRSFPAGDGINDVQTTSDSRIWISFFDEGVFGSTELGQHGLVCLDSRGNLLFGYESVSGKVSPILDCYALNVVSDRETWLYYYSDFPVVRLNNFALGQSWNNMPNKGASAMGVWKGNVWLAGSHKNRNAIFTVDLQTKRYHQLRPIDEAGKPLTKFQTIGRSHLLFLNNENSVYRLDLRDHV